MSASKSNWKASLFLIGILAVTLGISTQASAGTGVWWYGNVKPYSLTLINLTDHTLKTTSVSMSSDNDCYPYPFEHFGVNIEPYGSRIWRTQSPDVLILNYNGTMTFLPEGMDPKWSFTLHFQHQEASGSHPAHGTWIYLTAADTANNADWHWIPSWDPVQVPNLLQGHLGYTTPLNDGLPHNQMNLEGTDIAVTVYSPNNTSVILVVAQVYEASPLYRAWWLNWADNGQDSMPH